MGILAANPSTPTTPAPKGQTPPAQAPTPQAVIPFGRATNELWLDGNLDASVAIDGNTKLVAGGPIEIPTAGFLGGYMVLVTLSGGTGTAAVYTADGIFRVIGDISLMDTNNHDINGGDLNGWDLFLQNLYGGYHFASDPRLSPLYSAPTSGNGSFALFIPITLGPRDHVGALANMGASHYKLKIVAGAKGDIWSTDPSTLPTARFQGFMMALDQPSSVDVFGQAQAVKPPALGTTQYWSKFIQQLSTGANTFGLNRKGNLIRNLALTFRNSSGVRSESCVPTSITFKWDRRTQLEVDTRVIRELMYRRTGITPPTGVVWLDFIHDFALQQGAELRDQYLRTLQSSNLQFAFQGVSAAGTCEVMTNDVVVPDGEDIWTS